MKISKGLVKTIENRVKKSNYTEEYISKINIYNLVYWFMNIAGKKPEGE